MQNHLQEIKKLLLLNRKNKMNFRIPKAWNQIGFTNYVTADSDHEILVNPCDFFISCIEYCETKTALPEPRTADLEPCKNSFYSMMIRTQTAYDHYEKDIILQGTYIKALCIIPYLLNLGINTVYLLPVFHYSDKNKKGSLGSVYAVRDFYALEPRDHDDLVGEYSKEKMDLEFAAFVQACHIAGINVVLDFVFRTCARDNILIKMHPDWFYWIDQSKEQDFSPLHIAQLGEVAQPTVENSRLAYLQPETEAYLDYFKFAPEFALQWAQENSDDLLEAIEGKYKITTSPAFSDCLNDFQPIWSDVTYFRLDYGKSPFAREFGHVDRPSYIMSDTIKLSMYTPETPNIELWDYLSGIIPHYIKTFDIDGARIDMGHALPKELLFRIQDNSKKAKTDFLLWSEELNGTNSMHAKKEGSHLISGSVWHDYERLDDVYFNHWFLQPLHMNALPCIAALELPDTPRAAAKYPEFDYKRDLFVFTAFLPNTAMLINCGFELNEIQPMNLGLGKSESGRFALEATDPMNGRLAFFDLYRFHWSNYSANMSEMMKNTLAMRREFIDVMSDNKAFAHVVDPNIDEYLSAFLYKSETIDQHGEKRDQQNSHQKDKSLLVIYNRNKRYARGIDLLDLVRGHGFEHPKFIRRYYDGVFETKALEESHYVVRKSSLLIIELA